MEGSLTALYIPRSGSVQIGDVGDLKDVVHLIGEASIAPITYKQLNLWVRIRNLHTGYSGPYK